MDNRFFCFDTLPSTNDYAVAQIRAGKAENGMIVVAREQTNGHGRLGRSFFSPPGQGLYMSYVLQLGEDVSRLSSLTTFAGIAVHDALLKLGAETKIKWPNDIVCEKGKLCGILTVPVYSPQTARNTHAVIGIGMNLNQLECDSPPELCSIACSLRQLTGRKTDAVFAAKEIVAELDSILRRDTSKETERLAEISDTIGKNVRIKQPDGSVTVGLAVDITCSGALLVKNENGIHRVFTGTML